MYASYTFQGASTRGSSSMIRQITIGKRSREPKHGWKIGWHNFPSKTSILKRLNRTLAMSGPRTSCFGEINTHQNLFKRLYRALAMSDSSDFLLRRTLAMSDPLPICKSHSRRPFWQWCMLHESFPIIFKNTQLLL